MENYKLDLAWRYHQQGQDDLAIDQLRDLLSQDPQYARAHGLLASCLLAQSRLHAAEYEVKTALEINPTDAYLFFVRAQVDLHQRRFKQALQYCDEALSLSPQLVSVYLLKSEVYMLLDKRDQAYENIVQAASLEPDNEDVIVAYGEYHLAIGDYEKAEGCAKDALAIDAQAEDANILMGKIKLAQGNIPEAEYHAKFVISRNPNSSVALNLFSHIKMRSNFFLGLWWRANSWITTLGNTKAVMVLIGAYLLFNLLSQVLNDLGQPGLGELVSYTWLLLVVYSWVGVPMYYRALKKELKKFSFNPDF